MIGTGGDLIDNLLKATVILALGLTASHLAARARASLRHLILAAAFGALVALPWVAAAVPRVVVDVPIVSSAVALAPALAPSDARPEQVEGGARARGSATLPPVDESNASPKPALAWPAVIASVWGLGMAAPCGLLLLAFWRVHRIRREGLPRPDLRQLTRSLAEEAGVRRSIDVIEHEQVAAPLTCSVWRPAIVLPVDARDWDEADLRRAIVHELEHVRRGDWITQIAARLVCACYWFHPLAWVAWRRLCLEAERACDDAVVRREERTDYADQLVLLARRMSQAHAPAMLGMASRSDLSTRVTALLDDRQRRGRAGITAAISVLGAAVVIVMAIAPVRAAVTTPPAPPGASGARLAPGAPTVGAASEQTSRRGDTTRRPRGLDRALYEAAESGDIAEIDSLLQAGADVNAAIDGDGSPLIAAARRRRLEVVRHLLDRGADANMPVPGDGSPIIAAAKEGATAVVALLLDRGADINRMVPEDENALIQASEHGRLDVVKLLIARGADVNARAWAEGARERPDGEWRTPLSMARRAGHADVVSALVAAGARD